MTAADNGGFPDYTGTKILVVDDEPSIVELLMVSLKYQGFDVATASSGEDAMAVARRFRPDAFILDIMMPGLSLIHI